MSDAVNRLYVEGRNKLAHGESPGLLEDLSDLRPSVTTSSLSYSMLSRSNWQTSSETSPQYLNVSQDHAVRALKTALNSAFYRSGIPSRLAASISPMPAPLGFCQNRMLYSHSRDGNNFRFAPQVVVKVVIERTQERTQLRGGVMSLSRR